MEACPAGYSASNFSILPLRSAAGVEVAQVALLIDQPHGGDALDVELEREFVLPFLAVKVLRPLHMMAGDKFRQALLLAVQADADDLQTLGMIFVVSFLDVREFAHARPAPGRPKINQHDFAFHLGQVHFASVHGGELQVNRFADGVQFL
jgi:hypothetical protein